MAKVSKYALLVGQIVETKHGLVEVLEYYREPKVSKTGRKYKVGKLVITNDENTITVSIDSWNKQSFGRRLLGKVAKQINKKVKEIKQQAQEVLLPSTEVSDSWAADFMRLDGCYDLKHLKHLYRRITKATHPDTVGDDSLQLWFRTANYIYRQRKYAIKTSIEFLDEFNAWDKYNFYEEVDFTIENADWDGLFASGRA